LLQDPRVCATVDFQGEGGDTALHNACTLEGYTKKKPAMIRHLLQAGANPFLTKARIDALGLATTTVAFLSW